MRKVDLWETLRSHPFSIETKSLKKTIYCVRTNYVIVKINPNRTSGT